MVKVQQRIGGLFSGMDTDSVVKAMVMNQQNKVDQLAQKKTKAEWKRDEYIDLNNKLRQFSDKFISLLGSSSMNSRSSFAEWRVDRPVDGRAEERSFSSGSLVSDSRVVLRGGSNGITLFR